MKNTKTLKVAKISYLYERKLSLKNHHPQFPHPSLVHLSSLLQSERKKNINHQMDVLSSRLNARQYDRTGFMSADKSKFKKKKTNTKALSFYERQIRTSANLKRQKVKQNDRNFFLSEITGEQPIKKIKQLQNKCQASQQTSYKKSFYLRRLQFTTFVKNQQQKQHETHRNKEDLTKQIRYDKQQQNKFRNIKPEQNSVYFRQLQRLKIDQLKPNRSIK